MNERIKYHWSNVCKEEMPELDETCMTLQRQQRFAESLVRECTLWVSNSRYMYWKDAAALAQEIRDHFGIIKEVIEDE